MRLRRHDRSRLGKAEPGPGGSRLVPAYVTSVGVFPYVQPDGRTLLEFRPPEEVFAPEALASLRLAPVTLDHPEEMVDASNWREHAIGVVADPPVPAEEKFVETRLLVSDGEALSRFDLPADDPKLLDECSCGYSAEIDEVPGTWEGQRYDVVQRAIRYNHVALGPPGWGRHGPDVSVRLDAAEEIDMSVKRRASGDPPKTEEEDTMTPEEKAARIKELEAELAALKAGDAPAADAPSAPAAATPPAAAAPPAAPATGGDLTPLVVIAAKADAQEAEIRNLKAQIAGMPATVRAEEATREKARSLGVRVDGRTIREIMIEAIKKSDPSFEPKGTTIGGVDRSTDAYIAGRFDNIEVRTDFSRPLPSELGRGSNGARSSSDEARERMIARNRKSW